VRQKRDKMENTAQSIWRLPTVKARTGLSKSLIYQKVAEGTFPRPVPLSKRCVGWQSGEIENWISERVTASRTTPRDSGR
jgi:prophage regulatory protein